MRRISLAGLAALMAPQVEAQENTISLAGLAALMAPQVGAQEEITMRT